MNIGSMKVPFIFQGDTVVHPNPVRDGLILWYDFRGMTNTDVTKGVAKDLSGSNNNGALQNFNYTEESGYKDGQLVFDGVDDKLLMPETGLDESYMSAEIDGEMYVYDGDKVLRVGDEGINFSNRNLLLNSENISIASIEGAQIDELDEYQGVHNVTRILNAKSTHYGKLPEKFSTPEFKKGVSYTLSFLLNYKGVEGIRKAYLHSTMGGYTDTLGEIKENEWKRVYITVVSSVDNPKVRLHFNFSGFEEIYISRFKIEESDTMTPWIPAPEDFTQSELAPATLDSLKLYNKALNKTELLRDVKNVSNELKSNQYVQDGLILHYDFSKENNNGEYKHKAFDYSGNQHHGELRNFSFTEGSGYQGGGLKFDNVDDYVLPNMQGKEYQTFSIFTTVHFGGASGAMVWGGAPSAYYLRRNAGTSLHGSAYVRPDGQVTNSVQDAFTQDEPETTNIGMIVDNEKMTQTFVKDGEIVRVVEIDAESFVPFLLTHVGTWPTLDYANLDGSMYSFHMYDKALTFEEIQHNYQIEKERFNL